MMAAADWRDVHVFIEIDLHDFWLPSFRPPPPLAASIRRAVIHHASVSFLMPPVAVHVDFHRFQARN